MADPPLSILLDDVADAMNRSPDDARELLFDRETGDVVYAPDDALTGLDDHELTHAIEDEPDRFVAIPRIETREQFEWMVAFANGVDEQDVQRRLADALSGKGAFGRFRAVLRDYPDLRQRWFTELQERLVEEARTWLEHEGIAFTARRRERVAVKPPHTREKKPPLRLAHVLLLGEPAVVDGRARRSLHAGSLNARELFKLLVRDLCATNGVEWRNRFIEGKSSFELEGTRVSHDDRAVHVEVEIPASIAALFNTSAR
jgi:hypothetical protein